MTHETSPANLSDLLTRYLQRQASAHEAGLALPEAAGDVVPFDAAPAQPVDPRLAWEESLAAVRCFDATFNPKTTRAPADWAQLVPAQEPLTALPFATGNFPQLVRDLHLLLGGAARTPAATGRPLGTTVLIDWANQQKQFPQALLAVGALRLARQYDQAAELIHKLEGTVPQTWQPAWANEQAALAWQRGQTQEAANMWQQQPDSVPVRFNRGLAALFLGQPAQARADLQHAVTQLPEDSAWHHLGRLYLALAQIG